MLLCSFLGACGDAAPEMKPAAAWRFTEVGVQAGVAWQHHAVQFHGQLNMYDHGNGLAVGDINGDGHDDIVLLSQCGPTGYYLGKGDGTFTDRSALLAALNKGVRVAVSYGDYDNDGRVDLYVTFVREAAMLLHQNVDGSFTDMAADLGVDVKGYHSQAALVDFNRDGYLDLFVAGNMQYTTEVPDASGDQCASQYQAVPLQELLTMGASDPSALFLNGGPAAGFRFRNATSGSGVPPGGAGFQARRGFSDVHVVDFDRDGLVDLVLSEMFSGSLAMLRNKGNGSFTDVTAATVPQPSYGSAGLAFADIDNDGWPDLYMTDMHSSMWVEQGMSFASVKPDVRHKFVDGSDQSIGDNPSGPLYGNSLWLNQKGQRFSEHALDWHAVTFQPWGPLAADFDNDGNVDFFIPSGMSNPFDYWPNAFLWNDGQRFWQKQAELGLDPPPQGKRDPDHRVQGQPHVASARASAVGDFNEDGAPDLVVLGWDSRVSIYRNDLPKGNHWLDVDLWGRKPRDPYGAYVEISAGGRVLTRWLEGPRGYLSQSSRLLHVGLGKADQVELVTVHWPDGQVSKVTAPPIDRRLTISQP